MSELKELALRNIGRNIVNFQKIEGMLKLLLSHSNFSSPLLKLQETVESRKKKFKKQSLGTLANEYFKSFGKDMDHNHEITENTNETWISLSFAIGFEESQLSQQKVAVQELSF